MFEIKDLTKKYGPEYALRDVNMTIGSGMNFLLGASGSGKTTLLKILSGMEQPTSGTVFYQGRDMAQLGEKDKAALYASRFGFVWQDFHLLEEATVEENILLPGLLQEGDPSAEKIMRQLKIDPLRHKKVRLLSGGQKQRVAIARELMKDPQVIFCDEPTSALDAQAAKNIMEILRNLSRKRTVIVVTHDTSLVTKNDAVFRLDKGELLEAPQCREEAGAWEQPEKPRLSLRNACRLAAVNTKNNLGRFCISVLSLLLAGVLLLTALSGAIGQSGSREFQALVETYGEGILDIDLVGSFMSAAGGDEDKPDANVDQDLSGLYELYQDDPRVEFIVSMQPFENIQVTMDGRDYTVEKTGNSPVLTRLLAGSIPAGEENQVVLPEKFVESLGMTPEVVLGKALHFSATIYQWIDNQPMERPVEIDAKVCGVADNRVVYDYQGQTYSFTVDDSFFFNGAAVKVLREQAGITDKSANFTIRAKTPEDLIALKDELNAMGIVPLGRFELVEDIVRLNAQTKDQSGAASTVIGLLAVALAVVISLMTAALRRREYAICKVTGFGNAQLWTVAGLETIFAGLGAGALMAVGWPVFNALAEMAFGADLSGRLLTGLGLTAAASLAAFLAVIPVAPGTSAASVLKAGDKA